MQQATCQVQLLCSFVTLKLTIFYLDADRFHSDVCGEELQIRQEKYHRQQQIFENKRTFAAEREEQRWQKIEEMKASEQQYWDQQRELGLKVFYFSINVDFRTGL